MFDSEETKKYFLSCEICPRNCKVDRTAGKAGYCGCDDKIYLARAALHMWEEPCISGEAGSGTIFFSGCSLKCVFCQNGEISGTGNGVEKRAGADANICPGVGREVSPDRLAQICLELQDKGANNINFVTPTHYIPYVAQVLRKLRGPGWECSGERRRLHIPVVYNTGGYEKVEMLQLLDGIVDIYLPDMKYMDSALSLRYSMAKDYPETAKAAIGEMYRQVGKPVFDEKTGLMKRGVMVRHLCLPSCKKDSKAVIKYLYDTYKDNIYMSIMSQYTPMNYLVSSGKYPELNRPLEPSVYDEIVDYAIELGVENAFIQEGDPVGESFIPGFDFEGV